MVITVSCLASEYIPSSFDVFSLQDEDANVIELEHADPFISTGSSQFRACS